MSFSPCDVKTELTTWIKLKKVCKFGAINMSNQSVGCSTLLSSHKYLLQLLDVDPQDDAEEGANVDLDSQRKGKCAVIKTSTRQVGISPDTLYRFY